MSTPFTSQLGVEQGRIQPSNWTPLMGDFVFVLGSDELGRTALLNDGDYVQVEQAGVFVASTIRLIRLSAHLRPPESMPSGFKWRLRLLLDGTEYAAQDLVPGRIRTRYDFAINVAKLTAGLHTFAIRLEVTT